MEPEREVGVVPSGGGPLVYVDDLTAPELTDDDHHHLARVRRLRDGDDMVIGDGAGLWRTARFAGHAPTVVGEIIREEPKEPRLSVAFALVKGTKPELVVQKLTELGIDLMVPFVAERSVVRWDAKRTEQNHRRLVTVAREAAMQSRRAHLPEVSPVVDFAEVAVVTGACRADRGGSPPSLAHPMILIGPEGGWGEAELAVDLPAVGLGPTVLRAETAAILAGGLLAALRAGLVVEPGTT